jgi:hypothetical protein
MQRHQSSASRSRRAAAVWIGKCSKIISRWPNGTSRSARLHESLATVDTPLGIALKVDERRETSMPGIYAAGDLANPLMASVTLASSHGATAGISAQQSMLV